MRYLSIWLVFLTSLIVEIRANNNSIPSELLYLYYVYKMEYFTADAGGRTIAPGCRPRTGTGMCFFDDFVKYVMELRFTDNYIPSSADHTTTPKTSNLANIKKALPASARLQVQKVFPGVNFNVGPGGSLSYSSFLNKVLDTANTAMDSGDALVTDGESAQAAAQAAMNARAPEAYTGLLDWLGNGEVLTKAEFDLVDIDSKTGMVDWDTTLENINDDSSLSDSDKAALKTKLQGISQKFNLDTGDAPLSVRNHDAILKQFQDTVTQIGDAVERADPEITGDHIPPRLGESRCSTDDSSSEEESSDSDSDASEKSKRSNNPVLDKYLVLGKRQEAALKKILAGRAGISPISISSPGAPTTSSTKSSSKSLSASSTTPSTSSVRTTKTSTQSGPTSTGYDMAVTTVFSAPPGCQGGITEVAEATGVLWQNIINPAPSITVASCYPSQFVASALATVSLPPFSKLVCPDSWGSYDVNSTYAICCPKGFGLYAPNITNTQRPGLNAICTSIVWPSVLIDVTSYDLTTLATVIPETVGANATLVFATAFEGTTFSPTGNATSSVTSTSSQPTSTKTSTSTSSQPTSTKTSTKSSTTTSTSTTHSTITSQATLPAISSLPSCGQTCMSNMLAQYSTLGCNSPDPACLCRNPNFGYGIRDCANGACGTVTGSTVIAFGSSYCAIAEATETTFPVTATPTITAISQLPACGQTCMNNMIGQYSTLGCASPVPSCLCHNVNFGYGIRDCANGACGTAVATTVISFASAYCASATATA